MTTTSGAGAPADREQFDRFAVSRWERLVPLAWLMTGDHRHAVEVTTQALTSMGADWDRIAAEESPTAFARSTVLDAARSRTASQRVATTLAEMPEAAEQPAVDLFRGDDSAGPADDGDVEERRRRECRWRMRRGLLELPGRTRAVLLLLHAERLTASEVAMSLSLPLSKVEEEETRALDHLRPVLADPADVDRGVASASEVVREVLADLLASAPDTHTDPVPAIRALTRARRRRRVSATALVATALAVVTVLATVVVTRQADTVPTPRPTVGAAVWDELSTWPARGSLAGDTALLADLATAHGSTSTVYAGVVEDRTVVVLWNTATRSLEGYHGEVGASARALEGPVEIGVDTGRDPETAAYAVVVMRHDRGTLIVLGPPTLGTVEVSTRVMVARSGEVGRPWSAVEVAEGYAEAGLPVVSPDLVQVRSPKSPDPLPLLPVPVEEPPVVPCPECESTDPAVAFAARTDQSVRRLLGLPAGSTRTTTHFAGPVGAAAAGLVGLGIDADPEIAEDASGADLLVAHTVLPNGAVLRSAELSATDSRGGVATLQLEYAVAIDATTVGDPVVLAGDRTQDGTAVQVIAPGAAAVAVLGPDGPAEPHRVPVRDGSAPSVVNGIERPADLTVRTYDAKGRLVASRPFQVLGRLRPITG